MAKPMDIVLTMDQEHWIHFSELKSLKSLRLISELKAVIK